MSDCWDAEPSNRPTFTQLKLDTKQLLQNSDDSVFVQFPPPKELLKSKTGAYITTAGPTLEPSPASQRHTPSPIDDIPIATIENESERSSSETDSDDEEDILEAETRRRRHHSAPVMEGEDWNWELEPTEDGGSRRTFSNAYVGIPRHVPSAQVQESFEWHLEAPAA